MEACVLAGYAYYKHRSVMRIQRGKPKNSVTINCFRHASCRLTIAEARCPPDVDLYKWLFEVDENLPGDTGEARKEKAKTHMSLGRDKWYAKAAVWT